jgi:hypothetical protein
MSDDFSVAGREAFLSHTFYALPFDAYQKRMKRDENREFTFARWTLLERIVWQLIPEDVWKEKSCFLDGFDLDQFHRLKDGFVAVGRVWHLPGMGGPGDIPTIMMVEFDPKDRSVRRGVVWVVRGRVREIYGVTGDFSSFDTCLSSREMFEADFEPAFERDAQGWSKHSDFDLSIFLTAKGD